MCIHSHTYIVYVYCDNVYQNYNGQQYSNKPQVIMKQEYCLNQTSRLGVRNELPHPVNNLVNSNFKLFQTES